MSEKRVVITGMGALSCVGKDVASFWDSIVHGRCGLGPVTRFDTTGYRTKIAGEIKDFDFSGYVPPKEVRRIDLFSQYAIVAADEAMKDANLPMDLLSEDSTVNPERVGVLVSSGIGALGTLEEQHKVLMERGPTKVTPFMIPKMIIDMSAGNISMRYRAQGPNMSVVTACATSSHCIGEAMWMIKRGDADVMIAGGCEATIVPMGFAGFCAMQAMSENNDEPQKASRPFDAKRDGFVMAEGAGILILEEYEHAVKRGATIYAELVGYGATGDAFHITSPAPDGNGAARAFKMAMGHAGIGPKEMGEKGYINAHGTSTSLNDKYETIAIKSALGDEAYKVSVSSTKGTTGHALGATGALETIACIQALRTSTIPPTINYENPDPDCDLDITPNVAKERDIMYAANINLGFGGHNSVLILKKV